MLTSDQIIDFMRDYAQKIYPGWPLAPREEWVKNFEEWAKSYNPDDNPMPYTAEQVGEDMRSGKLKASWE